MMNDGSRRRDLIARLMADRSGSAAVEMALWFPVIGFVSLNVMDLGVYTFSRMQTELAAQAAVGVARNVCSTDAQLPATSPANHCSSTLVAQMTAAAQATSLGANVALGTPTEGFYCANTAGNLVLVAAANATPPANCSGTVTGSTSAPGDYISVTATYAYAPFAPGITIMSALSVNIQQTAWMRLK
jgi:Flp pilus assembly protein TadG